jgi:hypothetical protein
MMRSFFSGVLSWGYFLIFMVPTLLFMIVLNFFSIFIMIYTLMTGYSTRIPWEWSIAMSAFILGFPLVIPFFKGMYNSFPWLYPLAKMLFINLAICYVGNGILDHGFEISDGARHFGYFLLLVLQLVLCRGLMSLYFAFKPESRRGTSMSRETRSSKSRVLFGVFCLVLGVVLIMGPAVIDHSTVVAKDSAREALTARMSSALGAGSILSSEDEEMTPRDFTIRYFSASGRTTKIWVWDYEDKDGDYVQVLVDGKPLANPFMIIHKPRVFEIPAEGNVEIKGTYDGGNNGITCAVKFEANATSYFNTVSVNGINTYTVVRE